MKIQLKDSTEIVEVSSAKGAEMISSGKGTKVPVDGEIVEVKDDANSDSGTADDTAAQ